MKKERYSFFILFVEIAAIVFLHSAKNKQETESKSFTEKKPVVSTPYQLKALSLTQLK